jgi:hypothetical protein
VEDPPPQEVLTEVVNHVVVSVAANPHGWTLMWTCLDGIRTGVVTLTVHKCLVFLCLLVLGW